MTDFPYLLKRNGFHLKVDGFHTNSDTCCCDGSIPGDCPEDCDDCPSTIDVTITNWGVCSCREDTYQMAETIEDCDWAFNVVGESPILEACCHDTGLGIILDCVVIDDVSYWRLQIGSSLLLNDGEALCDFPGQVTVAAYISLRPVANPNLECPPLGTWTMSKVGAGSQTCPIPTVVLS